MGEQPFCCPESVETQALASVSVIQCNCAMVAEHSQITTLHLALGADKLTWSLEFDPQGRKKAFVHGGGYALSYMESHIPDAMKATLTHLKRGFESLGDGPLPLEDVLSTVRRLVTQLGPKFHLTEGAPLRLQSLPQWSTALRIGRTPISGRGIWPFDPELTGLRQGLRQVVKREYIDPSQKARDRDWFEASGFQGIETPSCSFFGNDRSVLEEAARLEAAYSTTASDIDACRGLGTLLGYPTCCIEAFVTHGRQDDLMLALNRLPQAPERTASPWTQWLLGPLSIISHTPCNLWCEATISAARSLLMALDTQTPGFTKRWEELARRVQTITHDGACLSLLIDEDGRISNAFELRTQGRIEDVLTTTTGVVGRPFDREDFVLIADHRGLGDPTE
jgi:hypothetical protein